MGLVMADTYNPGDQAGKKISTGIHTDTIFSLSVAPDGSALASASFDGSVKIWTAPPAA